MYNFVQLRPALFGKATRVLADDSGMHVDSVSDPAVLCELCHMQLFDTALVVLPTVFIQLDDLNFKKLNMRYVCGNVTLFDVRTGWICHAGPQTVVPKLLYDPGHAGGTLNAVRLLGA